MSDNNNEKNLPSLAEAFLFVEGGTLPLRKLQQLLGVDQPKLHEVLELLSRELEGRGLTLVRTHAEASLAVASEPSKAVAEALKKELDRDIGEAGLEVLSIILYRGPSTRAQIDYIRGVNTSSTIRTLLARGLLDRGENPKDAREYLYRPTPELLAHLGVRNVNEVPDYNEIKAALLAFEENAKPTAENEQHGTAD